MTEVGSAVRVECESSHRASPAARFDSVTGVSHAHHVRQSITRSCQWHEGEGSREGEDQDAPPPPQVEPRSEEGKARAATQEPEEELYDGPPFSQAKLEGALHQAPCARSSYRCQARSPSPASPGQGRGRSQASSSASQGRRGRRAQASSSASERQAPVPASPPCSQGPQAEPSCRRPPGRAPSSSPGQEHRRVRSAP